jgi:hypothetical protein
MAATGLEVDVAVTLDLRPRTTFTQPVQTGGIYNANPVEAGLSLGVGWRR